MEDSDFYLSEQLDGSKTEMLAPYKTDAGTNGYARDHVCVCNDYSNVCVHSRQLPLLVRTGMRGSGK